VLVLYMVYKKQLLAACANVTRLFNFLLGRLAVLLNRPSSCIREQGLVNCNIFILLIFILCFTWALSHPI